MYEDEEPMEDSGDNLTIAWMLGANQSNNMLRAQRELLQKYKTALADAVRRPMGVVPDSAVGLVTNADLDNAEQRRLAERDAKSARCFAGSGEKGSDEAF